MMNRKTTDDRVQMEAMNAVSKTLYIPLRGKAMVSQKGILLKDPMAQEIWQKEGFPLHGKSSSKWLAYFMGMRAAVFDDWTSDMIRKHPNAVVLHLGCGLDSRAHRVKAGDAQWYDVDMPSVIDVRRRYDQPTERYHMLGANVTEPDWLDKIGKADCAIVVMEGLSMYLSHQELTDLMLRLQQRFAKTYLLMDVYTTFAAKASRFINPIKDVGASVSSGIDSPHILEANECIRVISGLSLTPKEKINELSGFDRWFFRLMFAGRATDKIYRLFVYELLRDDEQRM